MNIKLIIFLIILIIVIFYKIYENKTKENFQVQYIRDLNNRLDKIIDKKKIKKKKKYMINQVKNQTHQKNFYIIIKL